MVQAHKPAGSPGGTGGQFDTGSNNGGGVPPTLPQPRKPMGMKPSDNLVNIELGNGPTESRMQHGYEFKNALRNANIDPASLYAIGYEGQNCWIRKGDRMSSPQMKLPQGWQVAHYEQQEDGSWKKGPYMGSGTGVDIASGHNSTKFLDTVYHNWQPNPNRSFQADYPGGNNCTLDQEERDQLETEAGMWAANDAHLCDPDDPGGANVRVEDGHLKMTVSGPNGFYSHDIDHPLVGDEYPEPDDMAAIVKDGTKDVDLKSIKDPDERKDAEALMKNIKAL